MKQEDFESRYTDVWDQFEQWNRVLSGAGAKRHHDIETIGREFPAMYRRICHHLSLARARRYSLGLQQRLNQLALDGHRHLYRQRVTFIAALGRFIANDFPSCFRECGRYMLLSAMLFYLPALAMGMAVQLKPDLVYSLLDAGTVATMEQMYDPANDVLGRERQSDTDVAMFGFYIYNNVSIGFRTFAGGLVFGIGSVFFLGFNGLYLGTIASHLVSAGFSETFWTFVAGHSSFELTAIVIFGGVGLMIGYATIAPGRKRRWHAVRDAARRALPLIYGGTLMLVIAAFVEAFWSSTTWPASGIKYAVGGGFWLLHFVYFGLMGRR